MKVKKEYLVVVLKFKQKFIIKKIIQKDKNKEKEGRNVYSTENENNVNVKQFSTLYSMCKPNRSESKREAKDGRKQFKYKRDATANL